MTVLLLAIGTFAFIAFVFMAAADQLWGPDTDLEGEWTPGDRPWWKP